jgi:hypothetical protein
MSRKIIGPVNDNTDMRVGVSRVEHIILDSAADLAATAAGLGWDDLAIAAATGINMARTADTNRDCFEYLAGAAALLIVALQGMEFPTA